MCIRDRWAYFEIKDTDGKEISNYGEYTVESSDKTTLMILGNTMQKNNRVPVSYTHLILQAATFHGRG